MNLKTLIHIIDPRTTVLIIEEYSHEVCPKEDGCYDCENANWGPGDVRCGLSDEEKKEVFKTEIDTFHLYNDYAEDVPYKLLERKVKTICACIEEKKGRKKKPETKPIIEIVVEGEQTYNPS